MLGSAAAALATPNASIDLSHLRNTWPRYAWPQPRPTPLRHAERRELLRRAETVGEEEYYTVGEDSPTTYSWHWEVGFVGGGEVAPPANLTLDEALAQCHVLPRCRSVSFEAERSPANGTIARGKSVENSTRTMAYFTVGTTVSEFAGMTAWVKTADAPPPVAKLKVGGTSDLQLELRDRFFTLQSLQRTGENWSFSRPIDEVSVLPNSALVGDVTLRVRSADGGWASFSTIALGAPAKPLKGYPMGRVLAAQDVSALLNSSSSTPLPLSAVRSYERSADDAALVLRLNLTNTGSSPVELGALGFALPENEGNPPVGIEGVVWNDPHVGGDHGFVEFVRVVKDEATLLVTAASPAETPTPLEAWRPMLEENGHGDAYEWTVFSAAWAEEWAQNSQWPFLNLSTSLAGRIPASAVASHPQTPWPAAHGPISVPRLSGGASPWNTPTSLLLQPGETRSFALRFTVVPDGPRGRDAALAHIGAPVLQGVPGFVLAPDLASSLHVKPPTGASIVGAAATAVGEGNASLTVFKGHASGPDYDALGLVAEGRGRVRLTVNFSDGTAAVAHYMLLPSFSTQVERFSDHLTDAAWLPRDYPDPFGRGASVMPWDRSSCEGATGTAPCGHVLDDARAYDVGLSDDAGAGNPLALASLVRAAPTQHAVDRIDDFIRWTLYGVKPDTARPPLRSLQLRPEDVLLREDDEVADPDGVRMTMFYYDESLGQNHSSGHFAWNYSEAEKCSEPFGSPTWCMTENMANATYRAFNYPHVTASWLAMYHVARNHDQLQTRQPWWWYLERAVNTTIRFGTLGTGVMDGTVFREVLRSARAEGKAGNLTLAKMANEIELNMRRRQEGWAVTPYPYGSEFGFDTTGQEEVVVWSLEFGDMVTAKNTVDHILSYMRSSPTWAYHGGSRSWGDIGNNGKYLLTFGTGVQDRGQMHYRSGLNMIPLIEWYRAHPDDLFLLQVSMGAISGQMANIDESGATSMMFHAVPHANEFDPHSGDYGLGFFGNALESGAYYVKDFALGPLCFLCNLQNASGDDDNVNIVPRDAFRRAVYLEPLALYMEAQAGKLERIVFSPSEQTITVTFAAPPAGGASYSSLRLLLTKTSEARPGQDFAIDDASLIRGAYEITPDAQGGETSATIRYKVTARRGASDLMSGGGVEKRRGWGRLQP